MLLDGLEDAYDKGKPMGAFAEDTARSYQISRAAQDDYALRSLERARAAQASGAFDAEIVPVMTGKDTIRIDEQPGRAKPEKIPALKPAFASDGTITAASSASISDGAAALVLTRESLAKARGALPIARIIGHAAHAQAPALFTTAPVFAVRKLLSRIGWQVSDVDLFEVNEAFAVVALVAMRELDIPADRLNIHGGACALGHPIGASGARILTTLISALRAKGMKRGVASLCIGGGEATAMAVELAA
jgi:acetyl-CoA C-acetyltransferase